MSGDCPHRTQLDYTLVEYQRQTTLLATIQSDYLHIVGELKSELDTLSCQVTTILENDNTHTIAPPSALYTSTEKIDENIAISPGPQDTVQEPAKDIDINLIGTLQDLEHQNDLLQAALVRATKDRGDYWLELEEKNAYLQSHIETMRDALAEKNKLIIKQNNAIAKLSLPMPSVDMDTLKDVRSQLRDAYLRIENLEKEVDRCRNSEQIQIRDSRKINDELIESKRKNERLRSLLNDSSDNYETLQKKYEALSKTSEQQSKKIQNLEQRLTDFQSTLSNGSMETKLLQHQLSTLRQKDATTHGEFKALQDRYFKIDEELRISNETITKLKCSFHLKEDQYIRNMTHQEEINKELGKNLKNSRDQLEKIRKQYDDLSTISKQQAETIESYNKWKTEQRKADNITRESIQKYENYVKLLTEQNKSCLERCRSLHENNQILTDEIKRLRISSLSIKPGVFTPMNTRTNNNPFVNSLDRLRQTTDRVLRQKLQFNNAGQIPSLIADVSNDEVLSKLINSTASLAPQDSNVNQQIPSIHSTELKDPDSNTRSAIKLT